MMWSLIPEVAVAAYENKEKLQNWWKRLLAYTELGDTDIVILGRPSVGKSVLSSHLYGEVSELSFKLPDKSKDVETKAIQLGDWTSLIRVIPGQSYKERAKGLEEAFNSKNLEGLIYVTDWGYTDVRNSVLKESMIKEKDIDTIAKLRTLNMTNELSDLKEVLREVQNAHAKERGPKWLLVAVNKADLFFNRVNDSQKYYDITFDSEFTLLLREAQSEIGKQNFECQAAPISSYSSSLEWNNEKINTNIGGIEIEKSLTLNFIKTIIELAK